VASDYLLKIEGIKGESGDAKHKDEIEIESFSWGATQTGSFAHGGGGGAGKVSFQDIHFTMHVNAASPTLAAHCADGTHIKAAILTVRKAGKDQQEYYLIKLSDAIVSSYQSGGAGAGASSVPTDSFSLNYAKIEYEYKMQKPDGSLGAGVKMGWDLKKTAKV
jgi:type VI secretion system secreted protein Hcp